MSRHSRLHPGAASARAPPRGTWYRPAPASSLQAGRQVRRRRPRRQVGRVKGETGVCLPGVVRGQHFRMADGLNLPGRLLGLCPVTSGEELRAGRQGGQGDTDHSPGNRSGQGPLECRASCQDPGSQTPSETMEGSSLVRSS